MAYDGPEKKGSESKNAKFRRLAEKRTNAILDKIRILGHLSDKKRYEYSKDEVNHVFSAIEAELKRVREKFLEDTENERFKFKM